MKTNHPCRIVTLTTGERVLCLFTDLRDQEQKVIGYKMVEPFTLSLGVANEDGTLPIKYSRWCMYSPEREFVISGNHIIAASFPDENILETYVKELEEKQGITRDQIFREESDGESGTGTGTEGTAVADTVVEGSVDNVEGGGD